MSDFKLHQRLADDTLPIGSIGLNRLLLMNDARFPWIIMVPQRAGLREIHDLSPLDQTMLTFEMNQVSSALQAMTRCDKLNIAALGNMVPQLHIHVIARFANDGAWPKPVWGVGEAEAYDPQNAESFIAAFAEAL